MTKQLKKFMKENGITNILEYVKSLREYEGYIMEQFPDVHDEAWDMVDLRGGD